MKPSEEGFHVHIRHDNMKPLPEAEGKVTKTISLVSPELGRNFPPLLSSL